MNQNTTPTVVKTKRFSILTGPSAESYDRSFSAQDVFDEFFREKSANHGLKLSLNERKASISPKLRGQSFIYGEVDQLESIRSLLYAALSFLDNKSEILCCDLGSGLGKITVAAALLSELELDFHPLKKCYGIELVESLHRESLLAVESLPAGSCDLCDKVSFVHGDFLAPDNTSIWTGCDLVIANSTCFDEMLMEDTAIAAAAMRPGSVLVTLSKQLPGGCGFALVEELRLSTSWGMADFFIQRKHE